MNDPEFNDDYNSHTMKSILRNVVVKIEELSKTMKSVEKSIDFCSNLIDQFSVKLESTSKQIESLEINNKKLSKDVDMLKTKMNKQEQELLI